MEWSEPDCVTKEVFAGLSSPQIHHTVWCCLYKVLRAVSQHSTLCIIASSTANLYCSTLGNVYRPSYCLPDPSDLAQTTWIWSITRSLYQFMFCSSSLIVTHVRMTFQLCITDVAGFVQYFCMFQFPVLTPMYSIVIALSALLFWVIGNVNNWKRQSFIWG